MKRINELLTATCTAGARDLPLSCLTLQITGRQLRRGRETNLCARRNVKLSYAAADRRLRKRAVPHWPRRDEKERSTSRKPAFWRHVL